MAVMQPYIYFVPKNIWSGMQILKSCKLKDHFKMSWKHLQNVAYHLWQDVLWKYVCITESNTTKSVNNYQKSYKHTTNLMFSFQPVVTVVKTKVLELPGIVHHIMQQWKLLQSSSSSILKQEKTGDKWGRYFRKWMLFLLSRQQWHITDKREKSPSLAHSFIKFKALLPLCRLPDITAHGCFVKGPKSYQRSTAAICSV